MQKPASLRAAIAETLPALARDPDRLRMWVDKGQVRATGTPSPGFEWVYTLSLYISEYTDHPAILVHLVNQWLATNQPDLLLSRSGYAFEAEIVDDKTFDLLFELPLTEAAIVTAATDGGWNIEHPGEPDPLLPDELPLSNPPGTLREIWRNADPDERIVPV